MVFAGKVFKQIIGIQIGTSCALLVTNIFLYFQIEMSTVIWIQNSWQKIDCTNEQALDYEFSNRVLECNQ